MDLRAVRFARSLALASASLSPVLACGGSQPTSTTPKPETSTSATATATATSSSNDSSTGDGSMPTDGPCRCSWDTNAQAAPRVCKRGEVNYDGAPCVPGGGYGGYEGKYPRPVVGPLPPPELRARRGRAKRARR